MYISRQGRSWMMLIILFVAAADADGQCDGDGCEERHNAWTSQGECLQERMGWDSFVCVCTASVCDMPGSIPHPQQTDVYTVVTSDRQHHRFHVTHGTMSTAPTGGGHVVHLNTRIAYQQMLGFGGSVTDASGIVFFGLSEAVQDLLIRSYFGADGIAYNIVRTPIGGSDFSKRPYSYDDRPGDVALAHFALAQEDLMYKVPLLKRAQTLAKETSELKIFASPWSPPAWMKNNGRFNGSGSLIPAMRQPYADYIVKFLDEYSSRGLRMWGITTQNEPLAGLQFDVAFNAMVFTAEDMRAWLVENLLPALTAGGHDDLELIISDQGRDHLPHYPAQILAHDELSRRVSGIGIHWYQDTPENLHHLTETRAVLPDYFTLHTEACLGYDSPPTERVKLGDWGRAERYASSIIETSNRGTSGWVDWNLALDLQGGPNWASNFVDSPIIVDTEHDKFYRQPMYYALGHFSKFVARGARAVYMSLLHAPLPGVAASAFLNPDGGVVVVLLNSEETETTVSLQPRMSQEKYINIVLPAKSIQTVLFRAT
ncbi:lysosomal acid glucosylceramidase isoform X2 [Hyalella azteca]|uniref:Glucosylceramidase n=1 Tax=Hyalella azteca TaxID=294128 RepID=A0A8B7N9Y1_HYAAZ|nr:lysosomal acid glucosylceramidase isoform X2 [Hyalella azteca]